MFDCFELVSLVLWPIILHSTLDQNKPTLILIQISNDLIPHVTRYMTHDFKNKNRLILV